MYLKPFSQHQVRSGADSSEVGPGMLCPSDKCGLPTGLKGIDRYTRTYFFLSPFEKCGGIGSVSPQLKALGGSFLP